MVGNFIEAINYVQSCWEGGFVCIQIRGNVSVKSCHHLLTSQGGAIFPAK